MLGLGVQHGGVGPAGDAFLGEHGGDGLAFGLQGVGLVRPGAGGDHAFVLEVAHLHGGVVPVAVDQVVLLAQQVEHGGVLLLVELVGVGDAQGGLGGLEVEGGVGDVDRAVIGLHAALVGLAVGQVLRFEHHGPAVRRLGEGLGVVHQQVGAPLVGGAVGLAGDGVPGRVLQARVDVLPVGDQVGVDGLHALAVDQAQRGVAGGGDQVVAALGHEADHLVGGGGGLHVDLAAGVLLELADPVVVLVGLAAFDVAGPGDDVEAAFAGSHGGDGVGGLEAGTGEQAGGDGAEQGDLAHWCLPRCCLFW